MGNIELAEMKRKISFSEAASDEATFLSDPKNVKTQIQQNQNFNKPFNSTTQRQQFIPVRTFRDYIKERHFSKNQSIIEKSFNANIFAFYDSYQEKLIDEEFAQLYKRKKKIEEEHKNVTSMVKNQRIPGSKVNIVDKVIDRLDKQRNRQETNVTRNKRLISENDRVQDVQKIAQMLYNKELARELKANNQIGDPKKIRQVSGNSVKSKS